jgi:CubicO group peptidase (beta-lactamase class C family)
VDAVTRTSRLRAALESAGAARGVVACRTAEAGAVVRSWGPVSATAVFEAGSVTKTVTGLLLALAIQAGEVSGSDRLDRFLTGTGPAGGATLGELGSHTSGLPRLPAAMLIRSLGHPGQPYRGASLSSLVRDTRRVRLRRAGEAAYSNLGMALLGHGLAVAATVPYWELARSRVLTPLRMTSSGDLPESALAAPAGAWDLGAYGPAGGLRATAGDLLRLAWVAVRPGDSPFPAAATEALRPRAVMNNGHVSWGWMLRTGPRGTDAWHNGATGTGWAFIGASSSCAIAACVPARRQPDWDTAALQALGRPDANGEPRA